MNGIDKQKKWFELLKAVSYTPIKVCRNFKGKPGKRKFAEDDSPPWDHRTICANEIVIDLDAKGFSTNSKFAKVITEYFKSQEIPHYVYWSGGKGIHIHIFLDIDIHKPEVLKLVKEAMDKGCNLYSLIRQKLAADLIEESGIDPSKIGIGKLIDLAKLKWDDVGGSQINIRCCGGIHQTTDEFGKVTRNHKTLLTTLPSRKPDDIFAAKETVYPDKIDLYKVDEVFIGELAKEYLKSAVKERIPIKYSGDYLNLPCVQKVLEGMSEGKRSYAGQILGVAARLDGKSKGDAKKILEEYAKNCNGLHPFTPKEAVTWVEWVYKLAHPVWMCGKCVNLGVCDKQNCEYNSKKFAEEKEILKKTPILEIVVNAVREQGIVGETKNIVTLFLVNQTKVFNPEWGILLDSASSAGKSYLFKALLRATGIKEEDYFIYQSFSGKALGNMSSQVEKWNNSIIFIEEIQGSKDALEELRVAITEHTIGKMVSKEVKKDGLKDWETTETKTEFKNVLFVTCEAENSNPQDEGGQMKNRFWIININTSGEQTQKILDKGWDDFANPLKKAENDNKYTKSLRYFCRNLNDDWYDIVFPFEGMKKSLPSGYLRARRDHHKLIALIKASALIHQEDRYWYNYEGHGKCLIADWRDVEIVADYCWDTILSSCQGLGPQDLIRYESIIGNMATESKETFGIEDIQKWCQLKAYGTAKKLIANLCNEGFFSNISGYGAKGEYKKTGMQVLIRELGKDYGSLKERIEEDLGKWATEKGLTLEKTRWV